MTDPVRLAHLAASIVLSYPDESTMDRLKPLRPAMAALPDRYAGPIGRMVRYLDSTELSTVAAHYVDTFDLRRKCCLYLTYYTHGDTRRRGLALLRFRQAYRAAGLEVTEEELPDHLAVVLEFSAAGNQEAATGLLIAHRAGLDLLWHALGGLASPYAEAIAVVRAGLPPPGAADIAAARRLAEEGPPTEQVGLAPPAATDAVGSVLAAGS